MRAPTIYKFILRWVTPLFLVAIFVLWLMKNVAGWNFSFTQPVFAPSGYVLDLIGDQPSPVARLAIGMIVLITAFALVLTHLAGKRWDATAARTRTPKGKTTP